MTDNKLPEDALSKEPCRCKLPLPLSAVAAAGLDAALLDGADVDAVAAVARDDDAAAAGDAVLPGNVLGGCSVDGGRLPERLTPNARDERRVMVAWACDKQAGKAGGSTACLMLRTLLYV